MIEEHRGAANMLEECAALGRRGRRIAAMALLSRGEPDITMAALYDESVVAWHYINAASAPSLMKLKNYFSSSMIDDFIALLSCLGCECADMLSSFIFTSAFQWFQKVAPQPAARWDALAPSFATGVRERSNNFSSFSILRSPNFRRKVHYFDRII